VIAYEVRIKLNSGGGGGAECHVNQSHMIKGSE